MVKMRIPIREQLGCLVLLASMIGLAVVAIATWVPNFPPLQLVGLALMLYR